MSRIEDDNFLADLDELPSEDVDYLSVLADLAAGGPPPELTARGAIGRAAVDRASRRVSG